MDKLKHKGSINANGAKISVLHFGNEDDYPNFNPIEFDRVKNEAGTNAFILSL